MKARLLDAMSFISNDPKPVELMANEIVSRTEDNAKKTKLTAELAESHGSPFLLKFFPLLISNFLFSLGLKFFLLL